MVVRSTISTEEQCVVNLREIHNHIDGLDTLCTDLRPITPPQPVIARVVAAAEVEHPIEIYHIERSNLLDLHRARRSAVAAPKRATHAAVVSCKQ